MTVTEGLLPSANVADCGADEPIRISARGIRRDLWDWLYVEAARTRTPIGQLLNVLIATWQALPEADRHQALLRFRQPPDED